MWYGAILFLVGMGHHVINLVGLIWIKNLPLTLVFIKSIGVLGVLDSVNSGFHCMGHVETDRCNDTDTGIIVPIYTSIHL